MEIANRAGRYVRQVEGYSAFIPELLPPRPPVKMDPAMTLLLSEADQALARLDGVALILPDPDWFVSMYVRHEAVLSSQIEGTQSSLDDLLKFEVEGEKKDTPHDVGEVFNHVDAMKHGLERLKSLPLSLRLIREIHKKLMAGVRGEEKTPGEFRRSQNWIGPTGCNLNEAMFVPPPVLEMNKALDNFEKFIHEKGAYPVLIQCGLAHAQFETIHPFLDGNGRAGRLLITFLLCQRGILQFPLLYLSHYFKKYKSQYYEKLMIIRDKGDWEGWLKFFLKGVAEVSTQAKSTALAILELQKNLRELANHSTGNSKLALILLERIFRTPYVNSHMVQEHLSCSQASSIKLLNKFVELGILKEVTGGKRYRFYRFSQYLNLFNLQAR